MRNIKFLFILYSIFQISCNSDISQLKESDFRLFREGPLWELAKYVKAQEVKEFEDALAEEDIDFSEPVYGNSLLQLAVKNGLHKSVEKLLEMGANPNYKNFSEGYSAMHNAVGSAVDKPDTTIISMLISAGGDVNSLADVTDWTYHSGVSRSVLFVLADWHGDNPKTIKYLIRNGADINQKLGENLNLLYQSVIENNYKLTYFLIENGIEYREPIFTRLSGEKLHIQHVMKGRLISLESEAYKYKLKVIDFLEKSGIDYRGVIPTPKLIKMTKRVYPETWQQYLEVY